MNNVHAWARTQRAELERQVAIVPHDLARWHALAQVELALGNLDRGFELFEARLGDGAGGTRWETAQPRWAGEPVEAGFDGTLYVQLEQGLGDAVMMARYLPLCARRWAQVVCDVRPPLYQLFRDSFGSMIVPLSAAPIHYDFAIPMLSFPAAFRTTERTIPPAPYLVTASVDRRFEGHVGIAWAGAAHHRNDAARSLPFSLVADFLGRFPDVPWVSLQADRPAPDGIPSIAGLVTNVASTAAYLSALELVITCDSMLAHLAGALGIPCWVLLPYVPDWRWQLGRRDSPWYPTVRLWRQEAPGDWAGVLKRVGHGLAAKVRRA